MYYPVEILEGVPKPFLIFDKFILMLNKVMVERNVKEEYCVWAQTWNLSCQPHAHTMKSIKRSTAHEP